MTTIDPNQALKKHGSKLIDNGFNILPIKPNSKLPALKEWAANKATHKQAHRWGLMARGQAGIGINTTHTPVVDCDILDPNFSELFKSALLEAYPFNMARVGKAPKIAYITRTDAPFSKIKSTVYIDPEGNHNHIEILGSGQQCIISGIHPDTKKKFSFTGENHPVNTHADELLTIDEGDARIIIDMFESMVPDNWEVYRPTRKNNYSSDTRDADMEGLDNLTPPLDMEMREVIKYLGQLDIEDCDDYDPWYKVGMALWHQTDGSDEGFDAWRNWSLTSERHDVPSDSELRKKWKTFDWKLNDSKVISFKYVIGMVRDGLVETLAPTNRLDYFKENLVLMPQGKCIRLDMSINAQSSSSTTNTIQQMKAYFPKDSMVHPITGKRVHVIDAWLQSPDKKEAHGFDKALGQDKIFVNEEGTKLVNTAFMPAFDKTKKTDLLPIFIEHIRNVCVVKEDADHFLKWMAFQFQHPAQRVKFAPLIISPAQGTGRGWIGNLLNALLGNDNISYPTIQQLAGLGQGEFNTYLEASVAIINEVKVDGREKFSIDDKVRQNIDADNLVITRKGKTGVTKRITCSVLMFANDLDATIIPDTDRRMWFIKGPDTHQSEEYFNRLYSVLPEGTISSQKLARQHADGETMSPELQRSYDFLCQVYWYLMELDLTDFNYGGRAPDFSGLRSKVVANGKGDIESLVDDIVNNSNINLITSDQIKAMADLAGYEFPYRFMNVVTPQLYGKGIYKRGKRMRYGGSANVNVFARKEFENVSTVVARKELDLTDTAIMGMEVELEHDMLENDLAKSAMMEAVRTKFAKRPKKKKKPASIDVDDLI